ncbi:MAG: helix-turn-helix domain-containing protein [Acidimicrobiales bacterium]
MDWSNRSEWIVPGLAQILEIVLDAAGEQRGLTISERDRIFASGERAHEAGGSLSQLIEAYLAGAGELWENIFGVTEPGQAVAVGRTLRRVSESAVAALASGFEAAQRRSIEAEEALRREVIHDLLTGRADDGLLEERVHFVGVATGRAYRVLVAESSTPVSELGPVQRRVQVELHSRAPERPMTTIVTSGHLVVIAPTDAVADLRIVEEALRSVDSTEWRCGIGNAVLELSEVHRSYDEARESVRLARLFDLQDFVAYDAVLAYRLVAADMSVAEALVDAVVRPLEAASRGDLLATLDAFVAHGGNVAAVARALSLGPRSVAYRLDRIAELTGQSPRDPAGRLTLELALLCRRLVDPAG